MPIELHAFDTPNGRKISVALEEMALPYTVRVVDLRKREQFDPEFLKISPNGKIPAIIDTEGPGGAPISVFESGAILIYLGEKTGRFWPRDLAARMQATELQRQLEGDEAAPAPGESGCFGDGVSGRGGVLAHEAPPGGRGAVVQGGRRPRAKRACP